MLLLDVMGAFDKLSHIRLIHNLKKRRIGGNMMNWILSFLSNRSTMISLPEFRKHASKFAPAKFQLLHFRRPTKRRVPPEDNNLHLEDHTVESQDTGTYLGVLLDKDLKWIPHLRRVEKGASQALNVLNDLGGSVWGVTSLNMRRIYQACVVPKALYACSIWYSPEGGFGTVSLENAIIKTLAFVQRRAAKAISEAFSNTSGPALDVELYLLPIKLVLEKALGEALTRLKTS